MYGSSSAAIEKYIEYHPEERATDNISGAGRINSYKP